jgi:hypothetical protein
MAAVRDVLQAHPDIACPGSPVAVVLDADEELVSFGSPVNGVLSWLIGWERRFASRRSLVLSGRDV